MKTLAYLEKNRAFWFLLGFCVIFYLLRLPSTIEPYWYGDEGIYQVIGMAMDKGQLLYTQIWDNKPPLLYLTYALFGGDQTSVRFASLIFGLATIVIFFYCAEILFKKNIKHMLISTGLFVLFFATPYLEGNIANAENFILLPILSGALLILKAEQKHSLTGKPFFSNYSLFTASLLLGIAFLYKIVAVFDFAAFVTFIWIIQVPEKITWSFSLGKFRFLRIYKKLWQMLTRTMLMFLFFAIPIALTVQYFASHHALLTFFHSAFLGNIEYVGYNNKFIIPQGLLLLKLILLLTYLSFLFLKRHSFSTAALFILLWTGFSLFSVFFSQRPYTHYVLMLLPCFCLLIGLIFATKSQAKKVSLVFLSLLIILVVGITFKLTGFEKSVLYYQNALDYIAGNKDVNAYQSFFDGKTPRDYEVASFIKKHTKETDRVFIWGDNPQIYSLTGKIPIGAYTVAYHITQNKNGIKDTQLAINTIKPKYVIILQEAPPFPFQIPEYVSRYTIKGATIYEKTL